MMIVITGAAGFIGSCMAGKLNNKGFKDIVLVDDFSREDKQINLANKIFLEKVDRRDFFGWLDKNVRNVGFIFHIGARTDTTEFDWAVFDELNLGYSKKVWNACARHGIPLVYASSAATYGDGSLGYDDEDPSLSDRLIPLNPYGVSKNEFDRWVIRQELAPPKWHGLKFFNVFGPNEYHKGRMASVVFHAFRQVAGKSGQPDGRTDGQGVVRLFRSHRPDYTDGGQKRDFVYVKDVTDVLWFLMDAQPASGIYNLGTGRARTFLDLANAVFTALGREPAIEFIDTPADIRDKYQYFTEARMEKLRAAGYARPFRSLEQAVEEYVQGYLLEGTCF
ncbi:MAG TPA: ADP-glyceromanno-heptose 6-epimerase [Bacteroidales bacterium]|nr:ADP-glyceromanno-heptose 6-epimerase [Bacteroidales bacterium]